MHWSNPPHLIPMIEVVPGERTNQATVDATIAVIEDVGYYPCLLKKEVPGFVENRVLYAIMRECLALVDEGVVGMEELDLNVKWGIGYKLAVIPPMHLLDMAGMDIYTAVASYLNPDLSNASEVSPTIEDLVAKGRLGMKTKGGLFDYTDEEVGALRAAARRRPGQGPQGAQLVQSQPTRTKRRDCDEGLSAGPGLAGHRPVGRPVAHRRRDARSASRCTASTSTTPRGSSSSTPGTTWTTSTRCCPSSCRSRRPSRRCRPSWRHDRREARGDRLRHQLPLPFRPRGRQQVPHQRDAADQQARAALVPRAGAVRAPGLQRPVLLHPRPDQGGVPRGRRRDRQGPDAVRDARPHHRPLLAAGGAGGPPTR